MPTDCSDIGCENCEAAHRGFYLGGSCPTCGHHLCPRVVPRILGGIA